MSSTDDHLLLESSRKKERQFKADERTINKVEEIQDKIETLDQKEAAELAKIEVSRDYFNRVRKEADDHLDREMERLRDSYEKKVRLAEEILEKEKRFLRDSYEKKIKYYDESLENLDKKEEAIEEKYDALREKKSNKVARLATKVQTTKGKQLLQDVSQNTIHFPEPVVSQKSERTRAIEWLEQNGQEYYWKTQTLFPNYYRENEEEIKKQEEARKKSPAYLNRKIEAENAKIAEELERKQAEDKLGELNKRVQKALKELKAAKAQKLSEDEIDKSRTTYEALLEEFNRKTQEYEVGIY